MENTVELLLTALLSLFSVNSPAVRNITAHRAHIVAQAVDASEAYNVPPAVLLTIGFKETWLGTNHETDWGAPASARCRSCAGTPRDAARVLARGYRVCGTWLGSAAFFRSGDCQGNRVGDAYASSAIGIIERMSVRAGIALPIGLRTRAYADSNESHLSQSDRP
jgi:hypothetical protein